MDQAAVGFQLGFAGAFKADAAFLALQMAVAAHQPAGQVSELGEFDLQAAFLALGAAGKDGQNQADAVEYAALQDFFEIALLGGGEFVVEDDEVDVFVLHGLRPFFGFAAADHQGAVGAVAFGAFGPHQFAAGGAHQFGGFGQSSLKGAFAAFAAAGKAVGQHQAGQHYPFGAFEGFVRGVEFVGHGGVGRIVKAAVFQ